MGNEDLSAQLGGGTDDGDGAGLRFPWDDFGAPDPDKAPDSTFEEFPGDAGLHAEFGGAGLSADSGDGS